MADKTLQSLVGGGASIAPINSTMTFACQLPLLTLEDESVWLREGIFEDDLSVYPDAFSQYLYSKTLTVNSGSIYASEIKDGVIWSSVPDASGNEKIYGRNLINGSYVGTIYIRCTSFTGTRRAICWDGEHWVFGIGSYMSRVPAGGGTGERKLISVSDIQGMASVEGFLWILSGDAGTNSIHKFAKDELGFYTVDTGISIPLSGISSLDATDITYNTEDKHLWVISNYFIYQISLETGYTGVFFRSSLKTIAYNKDDDSFWGDASSTAVLQYHRIIGISNSKNENAVNTNFVYVRVK